MQILNIDSYVDSNIQALSQVLNCLQNVMTLYSMMAIAIAINDMISCVHCQVCMHVATL